MNPIVKVEGLERLVGAINNVSKQTSFAASRAINETAKQVQTFTVDSLLKDKFILRSKGTPWQKPGNRLGFNIRPWASKSSLMAIMGSQADWLKLQEEGGTKTRPGHRIAIPTPFWKKREEIMERSKKPRAILNQEGKALQKLRVKAAHVESRLVGSTDRKERRSIKAELSVTRARIKAATQKVKLIGSLLNKPFKTTVNGKEGIFVRTSSKRGPIKALFWFEPSTRVKAALDFNRSTQTFVKKVFASNFGRAIAEAFATARL